MVENEKKFLSGVVEGFYGRPWTTEQRKDLFRKLKKWGMDSYVYAPKDDYKHRAYWRELYTVEESENLTSLITAAKEQDIVFYYALSPGLDMTYSSQKELQILKRKLEQVSQFGCEAFALLFDDIEAELSKSDKEVFQTFANAQVSVTNEIYSHLNQPKFLLCPTQYCGSRAVPSVHDSEYLNTMGTKLHIDIDIMWTGNKVISKLLTVESIQEVSEVLRRPPVIWDNLHANDYDQKRVFLGPYSGRSPELIPYLRGVLTNPNCEFHANTIGIYTLSIWSKCRAETKIKDSISADIKLETETDDGLSSEDIPNGLSENIYHPKIALRDAIREWLPEFILTKEAFGPISKPQPPITMVMPILPIIPSVNTCMSLTTTTTTSCVSGITKSTASVPEFNTTQLQALADVCTTVNSSSVNPISNAVMNSLVSATKVIHNNDIPNTIASIAAINVEIPKKIPISTIPIPLMKVRSCLETDDQSFDEIAKTDDDSGDIEIEGELKELIKEPKMAIEDDVPIEEVDKKIIEDSELPDVSLATRTALTLDESSFEPMECGSSVNSQTSPNNVAKVVLSDDVIMAETSKTDANSMQIELSEDDIAVNKQIDFKMVSTEDLHLLCDLFYLPFEHGSRALKLLNEFYWLRNNAKVLVTGTKKDSSSKPEVQEWIQRAGNFDEHCHSVFILSKKVSSSSNKELCYDLFSYIWDVASALTILNGFVKWLALGNFPDTIGSFTQGSFTWFSKGWRETYQSGDQEPWVFRGGLIADLQRLMPVDAGNDLFVYKFPDSPTIEYYMIRPFSHMDEEQLYKLYQKIHLVTNILPEDCKELLFDHHINQFLVLNPELTIVMHTSCNTIVGYACAALDCKIFNRNREMCWLPSMCEKYPLEKCENDQLPQIAKDTINQFHNFKYECPPCVYSSYPSLLSIDILKEDLIMNSNLGKQLVTVMFAALRSNGSFGAHICLSENQCGYIEFYLTLGFSEVFRDTDNAHIYLARHF